MYRRRSIKTNTLVILSCFLYIFLEFGVYYFTDSMLFVFAVAIVGGLVLTHLFLEAALQYDVCFLFLFFSMVPASVISAMLYFHKGGHFLVYHDFLPMLIALHWLLPIVYCTLRSLFDRGPRFVRFNRFFLKSGILFALYYLPTFAYLNFLSPLEFPATLTSSETSLIPFMATATHIEDFIYTGTGIDALLSYAGLVFLLFLPLGFFGSILLKRLPSLIRALLYLVIPFAIEAALVAMGKTFVMDACIYRLLGILLGVVLYQVINQLFRRYTHEDFLYERNLYSFLE